MHRLLRVRHALLPAQQHPQRGPGRRRLHRLGQELPQQERRRAGDRRTGRLPGRRGLQQRHGRRHGDRPGQAHHRPPLPPPHGRRGRRVARLSRGPQGVLLRRLRHHRPGRVHRLLLRVQGLRESLRREHLPPRRWAYVLLQRPLRAVLRRAQGEEGRGPPRPLRRVRGAPHPARRTRAAPGRPEGRRAPGAHVLRLLPTLERLPEDPRIRGRPLRRDEHPHRPAGQGAQRRRALLPHEGRPRPRGRRARAGRGLPLLPRRLRHRRARGRLAAYPHLPVRPGSARGDRRRPRPRHLRPGPLHHAPAELPARRGPRPARAAGDRRGDGQEPGRRR